MRIYSWNVNGLRALTRKDTLPWKVLKGGSVICLQETKAHPDQLAPELVAPRGWRSYWQSAKRKGYSGTAIFCRDEPDQVLEGMGLDEFDKEGRVVGVRFGELVILSCYFPNSQDKGARLPYKLAFCRALDRMTRTLRRRGHEVVVTGDYNISHQAIDLARPKANEKNSGFLPEEREWMSAFLASGFRDIFRERNPELEGAYTWWSFRSGARERNVGWRLDYANITPGLVERTRDAKLHPEVPGSDHCPVSLELS